MRKYFALFTIGLFFFSLFTSCYMQSDVNNNFSGEISLTSIYISKTPTKLKYAYGDLLNLEGLVVKAKYSDGTEKTVDGWKSSPTPWSKLNTSGVVTVTITYQDKTAFFQVTVASNTDITAAQYFWGTWIKMDDGKEYEILDTTVIKEKKSYKITASSGSALTVSSLGTFTKESDRVMLNNNIPYFRKGGTNLRYTMKLVGFEDDIARTLRVAPSTGLTEYTVTGKSAKYESFTSSAQPNNDGIVTLTAPVSGDVQSVTVSTGNSDIVVVPGITVETNGSNMGAIALVGEDDYNLKITGKISEEQKDNGCLYGNGSKSYNMIVSITNISKNKCSSSICTIEGKDQNLTVRSDSTNLSAFTISTLMEMATKDINLTVEYGDLSEPYIDTGLIVTINNPLTGQEWEDFIPLRFFREAISIVISAKNPENNKSAVLNGFVIYPDGNNQYFSVKNDSSKIIYVPTFGTEKEYLLVFSGATTSTDLSKSTEMYYTVEPRSTTPRPIVIEDVNKDTLAEYIKFGGNNHSENTAFSVIEGFEAYLTEGEIDYYSIPAESVI